METTYNVRIIGGKHLFGHNVDAPDRYRAAESMAVGQPEFVSSEYYADTWTATYRDPVNGRLIVVSPAYPFI